VFLCKLLASGTCYRTFCAQIYVLCMWFQIFEQLNYPPVQHGFFNVVSYMLLSIQHSPVVFHKVFTTCCSLVQDLTDTSMLSVFSEVVTVITTVKKTLTSPLFVFLPFFRLT